MSRPPLTLYNLVRELYPSLCGVANLGEDKLELLVELLDSGNVHAFSGRMDVAQCGTERNHVEVGELGEEESALQTGVDSLDGGSDIIQLLVGVTCDGHDGRLHVGSPSGIAVAMCNFSTCESEDSLDTTGDVPLARLD